MKLTQTRSVVTPNGAVSETTITLTPAAGYKPEAEDLRRISACMTRALDAAAMAYNEAYTKAMRGEEP